MFKRFNIWFDSIKEPDRFFVFLGLLTPGIILTSVLETSGPGILYICALLVVRIIGK